MCFLSVFVVSEFHFCPPAFRVFAREHESRSQDDASVREDIGRAGGVGEQKAAEFIV